MSQPTSAKNSLANKSASSFQKEQRRSIRIKANLKVQVHTQAGVRTLHTQDISRHGMFLLSDDPMRERHVLPISMHLPQGIFEATAWVSRVIQNPNLKGAGLQLFTLSAEAKRAWDQYFFSLKGGKETPNLISKAAVNEAPDDASSFVVKLKSVERLLEFDAGSIEAGGAFLVTPVLRPIGSPVQMIMVHPISDEEFILTGSIVRLNEQKPKGVEIAFTSLDEQRRNDFRYFIEHGHLPVLNLDGAWDSVLQATPGPMVSSNEVGNEAEAIPESNWNDVLPSTNLIALDAPSSTLSLEDAPTLEPTQEPIALNHTLQVVTGQDLPNEHTFEWGQIQEGLTINLDIEDEASLWDDDLILDFELDESSDASILKGAILEKTPPPKKNPPPPPPPASTLLPHPADNLVKEDNRPLSQAITPSTENAQVQEDPIEETLKRILPECISARIMCSGCDVDASFIVGRAKSPLGLVADLKVFWAEELNTVISVPRLREAPRQRQILATLGGAQAEILQNLIPARCLLEVAALHGSPRHPLTREKLHEPEIVVEIQKALITQSTHAYLDLVAACPSCGGVWTLVRRQD